MAEIDRKLDKFFADLYGYLAGTERALLVRRELKNWIASVDPDKRAPETAPERQETDT